MIVMVALCCIVVVDSHRLLLSVLWVADRQARLGPRRGVERLRGGGVLQFSEVVQHFLGCC